MKLRLPKKKECLNIGLAAAVIGALLLFLYVDLPENNYDGVLKAYPDSPVFADISAGVLVKIVGGGRGCLYRWPEYVLYMPLLLLC